MPSPTALESASAQLRFSETLRRWLAQSLPGLQPELAVYVGGDPSNGRLAQLRDLLTEAGLFETEIVHAPSAETSAEGANLIILDPDLEAETSFDAADHLLPHLVDGGVLLGPYDLSPKATAQLRSLAQRENADIAFGPLVWVTTRGHLPIPRIWLGRAFQASYATTRFGSLEALCPPATDGVSFLTQAREGRRTRLAIGETEAYVCPAPHVEAPSAAQIYFTPPYQARNVSHGGFIAYAPNLRLSGAHGYIYDEDNTLMTESIGPFPEAVEQLKPSIWEIDPYMRPAPGGTAADGLTPIETGFFPEVRISEPVVVANFSDLHCYLHWLAGCLPRFWYLEAFPQLRDLPVVMGPIMTRYQKEYLHLLPHGRDLRFIHTNASVTLRLDHAYVVSTIDRPSVSRATTAWLRKTFLPAAGPPPAGYESGLYYISRRDAAIRHLTNEQEILDFLLPKGFQILQWSDFSVIEQISLAHHAKVIIGQHGSNMSNTIFCNKDLRILDIHNDGGGILGSDWFLSFGAQMYGARYYAMLGAKDQLDQPQAGLAHQHLDMITFKKLFERMMAD